jgi:O-phosphoseryl-tRNA(Cys) synthetase
MLLYLQAEWAGAQGSRRNMLSTIHRTVGIASDLARVLETIFADSHPDQHEKALQVLQAYKRTTGESMKEKKTEVEHGMLLDGKSVMDDALPELQDLRELVPEKLHGHLDEVLERFQETLAGCDVQERYEEKPRGR